jgi:hypothetical protein
LKNHSKRQSRTRLADTQKQAIRAHFHALRDEWCLALEEHPVDWQRLLDLHWQMAEVEHKHPFVKKAAA